MFLLITQAELSEDLVPQLTVALSERIHRTHSLRRATALLRAGHFRLAIIDSTLLDADPPAGNTLYQALGATVPVVLNLPLVGKERLMHEVKVASEREQYLRLESRRAAELELRSEYRSVVAGMVLACDQALEVSDVAHLRDRLASVREAAVRLGDVAATSRS